MTEILVLGQENPLLCIRPGKNRFVGSAGLDVANANDLVVPPHQLGHERLPDILVGEKPHSAAATTSSAT
jgi:hypothetical protein